MGISKNVEESVNSDGQIFFIGICVGLDIKLISCVLFVCVFTHQHSRQYGTSLSSNMLETIVLIAALICILPELVETRSDHLPHEPLTVCHFYLPVFPLSLWAP